MPWFILVLSGVLEAVWAMALARSDGFRRPGPAILFGVSFSLSLAGLAYAMTELPAGTAYAVWVGIGGSLTVIWAIIRGAERISVAKACVLALLIGSVVGLKVVS